MWSLYDCDNLLTCGAYVSSVVYNLILEQNGLPGNSLSGDDPESQGATITFVWLGAITVPAGQLAFVPLWPLMEVRCMHGWPSIFTL